MMKEEEKQGFVEVITEQVIQTDLLNLGSHGFRRKRSQLKGN